MADVRTDPKVFISARESCCEECHENLGPKAWITLVKDKGALCLSCADLDHLVFLPAGDAALTRRARKHSTLSAVVLKWSRLAKGYDRFDARTAVKDSVDQILMQWREIGCRIYEPKKYWKNGFVYVVTNPALRTKDDDVTSTGVPTPFEVHCRQIYQKQR